MWMATFGLTFLDWFHLEMPLTLTRLSRIIGKTLITIKTIDWNMWNWLKFNKPSWYFRQICSNKLQYVLKITLSITLFFIRTSEIGP